MGKTIRIRIICEKCGGISEIIVDGSYTSSCEKIIDGTVCGCRINIVDNWYNSQNIAYLRDLDELEKETRQNNFLHDILYRTVISEPLIDIASALNACMIKIIPYIASKCKTNNIFRQAMAVRGKYQWYYDYFGYGRKSGLEYYLNKWTPTYFKFPYSIAYLLDIAAATPRHKIGMQPLSDEVFMSTYMIEARQEALGKVLPSSGRSQWKKDMQRNIFRLKAGPSGSTAQLLDMVLRYNLLDDMQIEMIIKSLIIFYIDKLSKRYNKGYHTAAEIWSIYTKYQEDKSIHKRDNTNATFYYNL